MLLKDYFKSLGANYANNRITSFGSNQEFKELANAVICPLTANGQIRITGNDRLDFVHGQTTNIVKTLAINSFSENLLLNHKGHAIADLKVFKREDDLYIVSEGSAEYTLARFKKHIIFDQVVLQDLSEKLMSFTVQGANAKKLLEEAFNIEMPEANKFIQFEYENAKILINPANRTKFGGYDINLCISEGAMVFEKLTSLGIASVGEDALEISRVEAMIPMAIYDAGAGVLPQEAGLEPKLSYNKGCYLGQEIIARIHARGKVRRSLRLLKLDGFPEVTRADIILKAKKVGILGTVIKHPEQGLLALAVLRTDLKEIEFEITGVGARLLQ